MKTHYQIIIIGGGNAGISAAAQLLRKRKNLDIAIIEPSGKHYYQPAWTLVGGGVFDINRTVRDESAVMPKEATWIREYAVEFKPEENSVRTSSGIYTYDYLVVCPGIQIDWRKIKGLEESLGRNGVTSNYKFELAPYTYETIRKYKGGNAIFTMPNTPIKCGGAPQKIMYLAADNFRKRGLLKDGNVKFFSGTGAIFSVKEFAATLNKVIERYSIETHFNHNLVEIDGDNKEAIFEYKDGDNVNRKKVNFEMIHVGPPQSAPDFIKNSPLAMKDNPYGWLDLNKETFQHNRYANIFGLGDVSGTPNSKTGAAIRKQVPVVVQNLLALIDKKSLEGLPVYDGYSSCPLVTGYGKLVLAEFDYQGKPKMTFPIDQTKERWSMWMLKKHILPWFYWNKILKGAA